MNQTFRPNLLALIFSGGIADDKGRKWDFPLFAADWAVDIAMLEN